MTDPSHLTRSDFEALLWDFLHKHLTDQPLANLALDVQNIYGVKQITPGEFDELRAAADHVKHQLNRHVWDRTHR